MENNKPGQIRRFLARWVQHEKVGQNILQALPFWTASLITGVIAVFYAKAFALAEAASSRLLQGDSRQIFLLAPVCFVLAWLAVKLFAPSAGGSGIPQVMASIELANPRDNHHVDKLLGVKTMVVKILSSLLMVLGGGAVGREGPTIQIAGSIFRKIDQLTPASWPKVSRKNMIMTGAAAGLAAAFNTPLGGIVFAVEELAKTHISYFKTAIFTAVIIAGLTAQGMMGPYLYLGYPKVDKLSGLIFFYIIAAACIAGLAGSLMSQATLYLLKWKKSLRSRSRELAYVVAVALAVALLAYFFNSHITGSGRREMGRILFTDDKYSDWQTALVRFAGPILSFSMGAAGGIFAPSLSAGAVIGSWMAQWFALAPTDTNLLVLAAMVAFLTGVTKSPFTSAILVLEMTDRHSVIFHLMLAAMVANLVSGLVMRRSFYDHLKHNYLAECEVKDRAEPSRGGADD